MLASLAHCNISMMLIMKHRLTNNHDDEVEHLLDQSVVLLGQVL